MFLFFIFFLFALRKGVKLKQLPGKGGEKKKKLYHAIQVLQKQFWCFGIWSFFVVVVVDVNFCDFLLFFNYKKKTF